ncbi:hypothetical protein KM043_010122 [Ampulex compressa]|nr:hypothetical protein KM043_010122 [Ampulex compressa]
MVPFQHVSRTADKDETLAHDTNASMLRAQLSRGAQRSPKGLSIARSGFEGSRGLPRGSRALVGIGCSLQAVGPSSGPRKDEGAVSDLAHHATDTPALSVHEASPRRSARAVVGAREATGSPSSRFFRAAPRGTSLEYDSASATGGSSYRVFESARGELRDSWHVPGPMVEAYRVFGRRQGVSMGGR